MPQPRGKMVALPQLMEGLGGYRLGERKLWPTQEEPGGLTSLKKPAKGNDIAFPSFGAIISSLGGKSSLLNKLVKGKLTKGNVLAFPSLGATELAAESSRKGPSHPMA